MKNIKQDQRGFGHVELVIIIVVLVALAGGGWWVYKKQHSGSSSLTGTLNNVKCDLNDKDLCKFFNSWKANKYYTIKSTTTTGGKTTNSTYQTSGSDYHITVAGDTPYETIGIGNTVYTKASDGTWWKQTIKPEDVSKYKGDNNVNFSEPSKDQPEKDQTTYKKIGSEKCGKLTCLKYQVLDPKNTDTTEYIWFDTKDYQLQRNQTTSKDGTVDDSTFNYDKFTIAAPSPSKDLGPNQYLVPGQAQPMTIPSTNTTAPTEQQLQNMINSTQTQTQYEEQQ